MRMMFKELVLWIVGVNLMMIGIILTVIGGVLIIISKYIIKPMVELFWFGGMGIFKILDRFFDDRFYNIRKIFYY